jgi:hypothetical protein
VEESLRVLLVLLALLALVLWALLLAVLVPDVPVARPQKAVAALVPSSSDTLCHPSDLQNIHRAAPHLVQPGSWAQKD